MAQVIYEYLDNYDTTILQNYMVQQLQIGCLNTCQLNILCEIICKQMIFNTNIIRKQKMIQSLFTLNLITPNSGWGLIISIILKSFEQSQKLHQFYFNKAYPPRIKYLLSQQISLFQQQLIDKLISTLQQSLDSISIPYDSISSINLYTFQSYIITLTRQFKDNNYNQKQLFILSTLTQFFQTNPPPICRLFLQNISKSLQEHNFLLYSRHWIKLQLEKQCNLKLIQLLEIISKSINIYEKKLNKNIFNKQQILEIPYLYHFYVHYIITLSSSDYSQFEKLFLKYSDMNKMICLCNQTFIKKHQKYIQKINNNQHSLESISLNEEDCINKLLSKPQIYWKFILKQYLILSDIKFKKQTLDPLIFMMIKKQYWKQQTSNNPLLSICFWMAIRQWKDKLPQEHPNKIQYLQGLNKILKQFIKTLNIQSIMLKQYH